MNTIGRKTAIVVRVDGTSYFGPNGSEGSIVKVKTDRTTGSILALTVIRPDKDKFTWNVRKGTYALTLKSIAPDDLTLDDGVDIGILVEDSFSFLTAPAAQPSRRSALQ